MASTVNERKLSQGARITNVPGEKRGGREGSLRASAHCHCYRHCPLNTVLFNTDLEYSVPQMFQSPSTLLLSLNRFSLNHTLTVLHPMKLDVEFSPDGIMSAIKTFRTLKVWIREDQPVLNER